ncbi:MAG TPA: hypothetical protein VGJ51_02715 [Candidatus Angelobacter sp.]|jgi:hypothetical protein
MNLLRSHKLSILLFLFSSVLAHSSPRTYVSVNGSDGNTGIGCPSTSPCRSFGAALGVTDIYGEVVAIDSGDYPQVTVTQSATLKAAPGVDATIFAPWGDGVTITVGGGDIVVLRGLNVNGLNFGSSGIRFTAGGVLKVENCNLANFNNNGISMEAAGTLFVKDTEVQNAFWGIRLQSPAGLIHASIDGVHLEHGFTGVFAGENSQTTLRNSVVADYTYTAVNAGDYTGAIELNLEGCLIQGSYTGIVSSGGGGGGTVIVRVSHSTITDNGLGLSSFSASLLSYGNNRLAGNSSDGSFTGLISLQ